MMPRRNRACKRATAIKKESSGLDEGLIPAATQHIFCIAKSRKACCFSQTEMTMFQEPTHRRGCCWPMWPHASRPTHQYCGDPRAEDSSYCTKHKAMSIRNPELEPATPFVPYHQQRKAA